MKSGESKKNTYSGIWFTALFAFAAFYLSEIQLLKAAAISPLIIAILLGILYGNTLRSNLPEQWLPGIRFSTRYLLRLGIILFGFKITLQDLFHLGAPGILVSVIMVITTLSLGYLFGTHILKMDRDTVILTSAGSSICGAAAVLATEPVLKAEPYKSAIAVSTVVVFGTLSMLLYPLLYQSDLTGMSSSLFGVYAGGTVHEVAHVVAVGNTIGPEAVASSIVVKMTRVILLAPFLIVLGFLLPLSGKISQNKKTFEIKDIRIPWFAVLFMLMILVNSLHIFPDNIVRGILYFDTFILTMAMAALGMETGWEKIRVAGLKPIYLASFMYVWLLVGGYFVTLYTMGFCVKTCNINL